MVEFRAAGDDTLAPVALSIDRLNFKLSAMLERGQSEILHPRPDYVEVLESLQVEAELINWHHDEREYDDKDV